MKPFLCFLGGCEFEYIIAELKSNPQEYLDFDYFYSFEHRGETNPYTFLGQCHFKIDVQKMQLYEVDRVTELIQRTNQLNTSIKRYTKDRIISFGRDPSCDIFAVHVCDKFGDYGLVGVCIGLPRDSFYEIDTLLFSCRVMSKGVEDYTLTSVLNHARARNFDRVIVRFKKGPKNEQMQTILSNNHFVESACEGDSVIYRFDLKQREIKPLPTWFCPAQPEEEKVPALSG